MSGRLKDLVRLLGWALPPGPGKNRLLRWTGHRVHPTAQLRPCLVWRVERFEVGPGASVGLGNQFRHLRAVELDTGAAIGNFNTFSSHPVYQRLYGGLGASARLGAASLLTNRHHIDCAGGFELGAFSAVAGSNCTILTHSIDLQNDRQLARPVVIAERSFVATHCLLLGGVEVPTRTTVAAGSVVTPSGTREAGLWAGVPATWRRPPSAGAWFERTTGTTRRVYDPVTDTTIEDAF